VLGELRDKQEDRPVLERVVALIQDRAARMQSVLA